MELKVQDVRKLLVRAYARGGDVSIEDAYEYADYDLKRELEDQLHEAKK